MEEKEIYDERIFNIIEEIEDIIDEYEGKTGIEQALTLRPVG